ncbi:TonB-dependent siderophore receptor [Comamonas testosteroni]
MAHPLKPWAATAAALFFTCVQAQSAPAAPASSTAPAAETTLEEVRVQGSAEAEVRYDAVTATSATKIEAPLRDIPQTVNVVPQTLMRDQAAQSMQDVLKAVPGIGMSHGDGQRDQVTIRGFSAIADQFVDGMRDDALYFRDLSNIEQVEVLKGPASVLYGRGSSGGLINRITKKPGANLNEVGLTLGSWKQRRGEFDIARAPADSVVSYRLTGALERADSYRDPQFLDRKALAGSVLFKFSADTNLLLQADYLKDSRITDFGVPAYQGRPVNVSPGTYYGAANARQADVSTSEVSSFSATFNHRFNDNLSLRNALRYYDYSLDRSNTLVGSVNEAAQTATLTRGHVERGEHGFFNQTELTQKLQLAGMQHQMLYGLELGRQKKALLNISQAVPGTIDLFKPVLPVVPPQLTAAPGANNNSVFNVASAYVQDLVSLAPQWKLLAGVRYDRFRQETDDLLPANTDLARTDVAWSPRVGVVYQPSAALSYYASYSKSFQPSGETFALAATNAQLAPEMTTSKEVGVKWDVLEGKATATAALFQVERTNIKSVDAVTNRVVPLGVQRTNGLELSLAGNLPYGLQIWSGYAYLLGEMTSSPAKDAGQPVEGKRPTLTPRHSANIWLTKALGNGFGIGGGVNYVGARFANPGNTVTLPGYTTVDAMGYYRMNGVDLQLKLNNIFDRRYIVAGHGSSPNLNLPGAPRSVQLVARYRF